MKTKHIREPEAREPQQHMLRVIKEGEEARVDFVELFFDLVFVFAITQTSHLLLEHLTFRGLAEAGIILLAVWWAWVDTTWVTNWLEPRRARVRFMLFTLMLVGLVLTSSVPYAFEQRGLWFAAAYATMQVGRSAFMLVATRHHDPGNFRNFQRIISWQIVCAFFWIAGGFAEHDARLALWAFALLIESVGPIAGFWVPGFGASSTADWNVDGNHFSERAGLFIIIMLGESVLLTGATFAGLEWNLTVVAAFCAAFVKIIAMWWIYFVHGAEQTHDRIVASADPGRIARLIYTYIHIVVVAGIILVAVGTEIFLAHPDGHYAKAEVVALVLGGPAVFLAGNALIAWFGKGHFPTWRLAGIAVLLVLAPVGLQLEPLVLGIVAAAVLFAVALGEGLTQREKGVADNAS